MVETLIRPEELRDRLETDGMIVVDCRFYLPEPERGEAEYLEGHIPGAIYAHLDRDLSGPMTGRNGRHPLPAVDQMADRFSAWGIDDEAEVVVYDIAAGQIAARLWWMLRYLGHDRVALLDGALGGWTETGGNLRAGRETQAPRTFSPRVRAERQVETENLEGRLLIDARAPERYRGETEPLDPVAGHIPGARNKPTSSNLDAHGWFLPPSELRKRFEDLIGGRSVGEVVHYCGSGVTACHNLVAMEIAGIPGAKLYPGSWSEWCADDTRPTETKDNAP
jgi:thiosulfate/3-mercaptopyruvate sulfurtransferase